MGRPNTDNITICNKSYIQIAIYLKTQLKTKIPMGETDSHADVKVQPVNKPIINTIEDKGNLHKKTYVKAQTL